MTELIINGTRAVLPDNLKFTLFEENPTLTQRGEFSLDITLSLEHPVNARIFKHINRLNVIEVITEADASLIVDNIVTIGKIIDVKNTNTDVTFQYVAGNSELNWIGTDKKIWDFDWGTEIINSINDIIPSMYYPGYGEHVTQDRGTFFSKYICPPIKAGDVIINDYQLLGQSLNYDINWSFIDVDSELPLSVNNFYTLETAVAAINTSLSGQKKTYLKIKFKTNDTTVAGYIFRSTNIAEWSDLSKWISIEHKLFIQPYLLYYVNRLPALLGYTLGVNELNADNRAKVEYILNTIYSTNYADFLPDITVNEFIAYVENKFGVIFKANSKTKKIDIVFAKNHIPNLAHKKTTSVFDKFERVPSKESAKNILLAKSFEYEVESNDYFKYMKLSEETLEKCEIIEYVNFTALYDDIKVKSGLGNKKIIYRDLQTNRDYFVRDYRDGLEPKIKFYNSPFRGNINGRISGYDICLVNKFKNIGTDDNAKIKISIAPSGIVKQTINHTYVSGGSVSRDAQYQLPYTPDSYYIPETKGFVAVVEEGVVQFRSTKLIVALYTGIIKMYDALRETVKYPFSHVDIFPEFDCQSSYPSDTWYTTHFAPAATKSLVLQSLRDDYGLEDIDTAYKYLFTTIEKISSNYIYDYNGSQYLPISIEKEVNIDGINKVIQGTFYKLK